MSERIHRDTPWHLWVVGILALLWSAMGGVDFTMTNLRNPAYLAQIPPAQLAYVQGLPWWMIAAWAIGVWGAIGGAIVLLVRMRLAVQMFAASLIGLAISIGYQLATGQLITAGAVGFQAALLIVAAALLVYAMAMARRGVLR